MAVLANTGSIQWADKIHAKDVIHIAEKLNMVYVCHECLSISIFKSDADDHALTSGHKAFKQFPLTADTEPSI